ncbi:MAG TPA: hypothetical protein VEC16_06875 [Alphaproteobacteria bacterium]|nr:hypothetical protein [Alphaproteobacteria bacterium]
MQFNPDGSLKLSNATVAKKAQDQIMMQKGRCMQVTKEVVEITAPKKCVLRIKLSDAITDTRFIETIHKQFRENASTPTKVTKLNDKEFEIEIGSDFRRCTDCCKLVGKYREFLDGNIIQKKVGCTFEENRRSFSYEDYFD